MKLKNVALLSFAGMLLSSATVYSFGPGPKPGPSASLSGAENTSEIAALQSQDETKLATFDVGSTLRVEGRVGHSRLLRGASGETFLMLEVRTGDGGTAKSAMTRGLVPNALWWFRWGAMFTFLSGWTIVAYRWGHLGIPLSDGYMTKILSGGLLGTLMWFNVWFVIWPAQQVVIASALQVAGGGQPIPEAAARGVAPASIPRVRPSGACSGVPDRRSICGRPVAVSWSPPAGVGAGLVVGGVERFHAEEQRAERAQRRDG